MAYVVRDTKTGQVIRTVSDSGVISSGGYSSGGGRVSNVASKVVRDSISIGGTTITGFTDQNTGNFSPDASSYKDFEQIQGIAGTTNTDQIRKLAQTPQFQQITSQNNAITQQNNRNITQQMITSAIFRQNFANKIMGGGTINDNDIKIAKSIGISDRDLLKYADTTRKELRIRQYAINNPNILQSIANNTKYQSSVKPNNFIDYVNSTKNQVSTGNLTKTQLIKQQSLRDKISGLYQQAEQTGIQAGRKGTVGGKIKEFIYRGSADIVNTGIGLYDFAKVVNEAQYKRGTPQIKAVNQIKNIFSLQTLAEMGGSIGSDLQSTNTYEKFRGILSILPMVGLPSDIKAAEVANSVLKYETKINPFKGVSKVITETKGLLKTGEEFTQTATFRYNAKDKVLYGTSKVKIGTGKIKAENFTFKDMGGFYQDKYGRKIPKSYLPVKTARVTIKETTIGSKAKDVARSFQGNVIIVGQRLGNIKKTVQFLDFSKNTKSTVVKSKQFMLDYAREGRKIIEVKSLNNIFVNPTTKYSKIKITNKFTATQLENFLKSVNYDKIIVNGLDKRGRLAIALGLPEKGAKLIKIKKLLDNYFKNEIKGFKTELKGQIIAKGEIVEINKIKMKYGSIVESVYEDLINLKKNSKRGNIEVPRGISIPKLEIKLKSISRLRSIPVKFKRELINKIKSEISSRKQEIKNKLKTQTKLKSNLRLKDKLKIPETKRITATKQKNIQKSKTKVQNKMQSKLENKLKSQTTNKRISIKIPKLKLKEELKLKFPKFKLGSSPLPKGYTYVYDGLYRSKGKVKRISLKLPTNKALNKVGSLIDNTTSRSMQLVAVGIIKKTTDLATFSLAKKFKVRKGKKALLLVEKSRYAIDTKGEKRGLSIDKRLKTKKKVKKVTKTKKVMKKTIKRVKKSSKKTYKRAKSSKVKKSKSIKKKKR